MTELFDNVRGLNRPNWDALNHAYGPASDIPKLLAIATPDSREVWHDLWSRLCHQGTVYSASLATLPALAELAAHWTGTARISPLCLAAAILTSNDAPENREVLLRGLDETVENLRRLAKETLTATGISSVDFVHLLEASHALDGDKFLGTQLNYLASGELPGKCPACDGLLYMAIGIYGYFCTSDYWTGKPHLKREPIVPATLFALHPTGRKLYETAVLAGQTEVAKWLLYAFGTTVCPTCGCQVDVAIAGGLIPM